jgi:ribosome-associated translation inhibitor RaiA
MMWERLGFDRTISFKRFAMIVEVSTDNHISGNDELIAEIQSTVEETLRRFETHLTRVEVHVKDANGPKGGPDDKHCTLEARPNGMKPVVVNESAGTIDQAVEGASKKMRTLLDRTFGKLSEHKGQMPYGGEPTI